jgi:outer membrane biosynthesis protein TonB
MTNLPSASRAIWLISFLLAVAAHAALVLPWLWHEPDALAGAGGQELDVISFVLAEPGVLETREVDLAMHATPAPTETVEEKEGSAEEKEPKKEDTKELQEPPKPEREVQKPDAIEEPKPKPAEKSKQQERSVSGGAAARGKVVIQTKPRAPAAASAGSLQAYAKLVSQALARTKPKEETGEVDMHLAYYAGWPSAFSALPVAKDSAREATEVTFNAAGRDGRDSSNIEIAMSRIRSFSWVVALLPKGPCQHWSEGPVFRYASSTCQALTSVAQCVDQQGKGR